MLCKWLQPGSVVGVALLLLALALGGARFWVSQARAGDASSNSPAEAADEPPAEPAVDLDALRERGGVIYAAQCASCHGDAGQGVYGEYDDPLIGERSVKYLTRRIERTMPEGDADACVGDDAQAVAHYIYDAFYSPDARAAQQAARPVLQRLTAEQHRQTLADLVGAFREPREMGEQRGLKAQYYAGRDMRKDVLHEAVEPVADIVFTAEHPLAEQFEERGHSVRWSGSLLVPETGEYEIILRSDQAVRLWLNNDRATGGGSRSVNDAVLSPLIDGWVQSEDNEEFRAKVFLLAGRAYPLVLEFSSHTQGVRTDERHKKEGDASSYVSLRWAMPHRVEQVIAQRYLSPVRSREVFTLATPFPADDRSSGYERGVSVSPAWLSAATAAAIETAGYVVDHLDAFAGKGKDEADRRQRAQRFCEAFVERALRRPLSEDDKQTIIARQFDASPDVATAVRRVVLLTLSSPRFLYPEADTTGPDGYRVASRLALALWDSLPDDELLKAAERGELTDPDQVRAHAMRMVNDPRTRAKLNGFFHHWLELDKADNIAKDRERFPAFDEHLLADLRTSLDLYLEHVVWSDASDFRELLLADYLFVNGRLAEVYGVAGVPPDRPGFERVAVSDGRRSGVLTHPYLLTAFAYHDSTSPIHRGVFLTRNIVGRALKPPPEAIEFTDHEFDPTLTMREKVTAFTRDTACMACHATINPLGFSLEHFDGIGRYRTQEMDRPIDAESDFIDDDGGTIRLTGARDVAEFAADSTPARRAFARQLVQHATKQDPSAFGDGTLDTLQLGFEQSGFHIRGLFAQIAAQAAQHGLSFDTQPTEP